MILAAVLAISVLFFFAGSDNKFGTWTSVIIPDPEKDDIKGLAQQTTPEAKNLVHLDLLPASEYLGRLELINVRRRALAGPRPGQGSEVRAAVRSWHYAGLYLLSQTVQAALRPSACSS